MKRIICYCLFSGMLIGMMACHQGEKTTQNGGGVTFSDYIDQFPSLPLPLQYQEDSLASPVIDSLRLDKKDMGSFIPDSLWYPEGKHLPAARLYPLGKIKHGNQLLILIRSVSGSFRRIDLLIYGKADTLESAKQVASLSTKQRGQIFTFRLDAQYLMRLNERKELNNGQVIMREQVYGINANGSLELILTNTNQPASSNSYYNPIDTLPRKNRYSGDYTSASSDIVSIRDGKKDGMIQFFIHLDKNGGDCTGEVGGMAKFSSKSVAEYHEQGGSCGIRFTFTTSRVTIQEIGGCGAYRGISCYFDGTYTRKKEPSTKKSSPKKVSANK